MKRRHIYAAWLILGALSTYFGEVVTASTPFPFFTLSGLLVTYPFYTLNLLFFAHIAFRKPRVDLYTLFLAGQVFGLFEGYVTKMLWSPGWGAEPRLLGISVVPFLLLVFFWHPLISFTLPLMLGEAYLTDSREILSGFPPKIRVILDRRALRGTLLFFLIYTYAANQAVNSPSKLVSLLSPSLSWTLIIAAVWLWRQNVRVSTIRELLPTGREMMVISPALLFMYALLTFRLFPSGIPPLRRQAGLWLAYVLFGGILYVDLRGRKPLHSKPVELPYRLLWFLGFFVAILAFLLPKSVPLVVISWVPGVLCGIATFTGAVAAILRGRTDRPEG